MDFNQVIQSRRSIRKFKPDAIPDGFVKELLEAARLAPSGLNMQPWRYVVVKDQAIREGIAAATPSTFVSKAPVIILCCLDTRAFGAMDARIQELHGVQAFADTSFKAQSMDEFMHGMPVNEVWLRVSMAVNLALSIDHMMLKAVDLGLGSCWIATFDPQKVRELVQLGEEYEIYNLLAVGYPDQAPNPRPRLSLDKMWLKEI